MPITRIKFIATKSLRHKVSEAHRLLLLLTTYLQPSEPPPSYDVPTRLPITDY